MLNKDKKYTMKEFEEIFNIAMQEVIKEEQEKIKEKTDDPMNGLMIGMMTTMSLGQLRTKLFGGKDNG